MIIKIPAEQFDRLMSELDDEPKVVPGLLALVQSVRDAQVYNGMCTCRGTLKPHPFHAGSITSGGQLSSGYVGKHRAPGEPL